MSRIDLAQLLQPKLFRPFTLYLADGRSLGIPHPEFATISGDGRSLVVFHAGTGEVAKIIDLIQIVSAEFEPSAMKST